MMLTRHQSPKKFFSGRQLGMIRKRLGLSFLEFGRLVGISSTSVVDYETGVRTPSFTTFREIVLTFNLSMAEAFQLLKLTPPGTSYREFHRFLAACHQENLTPAQVMADFMRAYGEP